MSEQSFFFRISKDGQVLREVTLAQDVIKIGRMASSHLQIDDEMVSRMHAVIEVEGPGQVSIIDLGSETGTLVNGQKVNKSAIYSGDTITLGGIDVQIAMGDEAAASAGFAAAPIGYAEQDMGEVQYESVAPVPEQFQAPAAPPQMPIFARPAAVQNPFLAAREAQAAQPAIKKRMPGPPPATPFDANSIEDASTYGIEVMTMWQDTELQVVFYKPNQKNLKNFNIGEDANCDFPIQTEFLNGQTLMPLVVNHPGGGATVNFFAQSPGDITFDNGQTAALEDLVASGQVQASAHVPGSFGLTVNPGSRIRIGFGDFVFVVSSVPSPRKIIAPFTINWADKVHLGIAAMTHFLLLFLAFFDPLNLSGVSLDFLDDNNRLIKYDLAAAEMVEEELKEDKKDDENEGGKGKRHKFEEGQMGKRDAAKTNNKYGIKGPADNPDPKMAREMMKDMAKDAGILKYLVATNAPVSPFGSDTPLGVDPENALGALMGDQVGENFGYGGLGLRGTGRGGGGTGEGTIGLGNLGTIGHGGGGGSGSGYGRGAGGLGGRKASAPGIRSGAAMVNGSLSKEVIRRIVHRHINEIKFCYERQLASRPDLAGRVAVKFIISGTGAVQMAALAESTIGEPSVESCIVNAVKRWTFPQPQGGGIVIVTYPFLLSAPE